MDGGLDVKRQLRRQMRAIRQSLPDQAQRSERLWDFVRSVDAVRSAQTVMVFTSIPGEPMTAPFLVWLQANGKRVVLPEDNPAPDPSSIDVVIVPGTAFTARGDRLGQGGGWYDRFLPQVRPGCVTIGVCFAPQVVESLPREAHDVRLDLVATDEGIHGAAAAAK